MQPNRKRLMMSVITGITIFSLFLNLFVPVPSILAQEVTPEPAAATETPAPTDEPTLDATEPPPPTETATQEATADVTPESTQAVTPDAAVTEEAPTALPTPETQLFADDFQDANTEGWMLSPGWGLVQDGENLFLSAATPNETATVTTTAPADFVLSARVRVTWGNKAHIAFRAGVENYLLTLDLVGHTATVSRGATILGQTALTLPPADENGQLPLIWQTVNIQAVGDNIVVAVDGTTVASFADPAPLPAGAIIFSTDAVNTGSVAIDDININVATVIVQTPAPIPTAEATIPAEVTPEATPELTPELTPEATTEPETTPEPVGQLVLSTDFESELTGWLLSEGASVVVESESNHALLLAPNAALLPTSDIVLADFRLDARLNIASDATGESSDVTPSGVSIPFRTQEGRSYILSVEAGQTALYRNNGEGLIPLAASPTPHALNTWHTLSLEAVGGHLIVTVNGVTEIDVTEAEPLVSGQISFIANNASSVLLDDIAVTDLGSALRFEPTPEPFGLSEEVQAKLPGELLPVLELAIGGNEAAALELAAANFLPLDEANRVAVVVWAAEPNTGNAIADLVTTVGGVADYVYGDNVEARVPLAGFLPLVNAPQVGTITLISMATSTSSAGAPAAAPAAAPAGPVVGEGFDILSANDWHQAGLRGTGIRILVIDTGFNLGAIPASERCVPAPAVAGTHSGTHGNQVIQVLCDVVPNAQITAYGASTASQITTALNSTAANQAHVILITMDLGVNVSPGDGTGNGASSAVSTLYNTLQAKRTAGKLIIVSAGNNNKWDSDPSLGDPFPAGHKIGRYFSMTAGNGSAVNISIPVMIAAGDIIRVSWNDWNDNLNGTTTRENYGLKLGARAMVTVTGQRATTSDPSVFSTVTTADCPSGDICSATLQIGGDAGSFGDSGPVFFQVQISGEGLIDGEGPITGVTGVDFNAGNIGRPADSPAVVTVGAVCARPNNGFPVLRESSVGPIFAAGGSGPAGIPSTRAGFKPDLVGPSDVSIAGNVLPDTANDVTSCDDGTATGFSGTSAAAAYVAAMSALIQQNTNANVRPGAAWNAQAVIDYLQSHTVDLPRGDAANGFDVIYGAGLTTLGDPAPTAPINPPIPEGGYATVTDCGVNARYVRPGNLDANFTAGNYGSIDNPYIHPADALADSGSGACVVLLPGEYVSGILADSTTASNIKLRSYQYTFPSAADSIIWTNIGIRDGEGGIVVDTNSLSVQGFVFKQANPADVCNNNPSQLAPFQRPVAIVVTDAPGGNIISNNTISGFRGFGPTDPSCTSAIRPLTSPFVVTHSNGVTVQNNTFSDNDADNGAAMRIEDSGTGSPIVIQNNLFKQNAASANSNFFAPTVRIQEAAVQLYNNRFVGNSTPTIVSVDDGTGNNPNNFSGPPVIMFGNAFSRNMNNRSVVHLNPGRRFRFINNTVAGSIQMENPGDYSGIIVRGQGNGTLPAQGGTGMNGNGLFDIHNNIFYGNNAQSLIRDQGGQFTCNSNDGGAENGAKNNWAFASGDVAGVCQVPLGLFNNDINVDAHDPLDPFDPVSLDASQFVGPDIGLDDPYQIKGMSFGVDYADETLVGFNPALLSGLDVVGNPRVSGTGGLDVGAYEYKAVTPTTPTLPDGSPIGPFPEDYIDLNLDSNPATGVVEPPTSPVIRLQLNADGGFKPYTFELVSDPLNYSTDTSNMCGGAPAAFNQTTGEVYYCPPRHFYNQGLGPEAAVSFQYRVRDNAGNFSEPATVNLTITPENDTPLASQPAPTQTYSVVGVVTDPPSEIQFRIRPYARFGNFRIGAPGDPNLPASQDGTGNGLQADYPYTYSNISFPTLTCPPACDNPNLFGPNRTASQNAITAAFNAMGANGGVLKLTPAVGQTGFMEFEYQVKDRNNNPTSGTYTNRVRLVVVGDLPDSGLHDDTSFTFNYRGADETKPGSWTPIYNETTINNTLHTTTAAGDTAEFLFDGVGFALYMQGASNGAQWELKVENAGIEVPLSWSPVPGVTGQLQAAPPNTSIQCRTSATAVAGKPALLSNVTANQPYVVSCTGFLDGEANKVIVINQQAGRTVSIDAIGILQNSSPLLPGIHEVTERQLLSTFSRWTPSVVAQAVGQRVVSTSNVNDDVRFTFQGGTGFAIGTALQRTALKVDPGLPLGVQYKVCFSEVTNPTNRTCQRFDNGVGASTALMWKVFRSFYGFDPDKTYEVTIDILNIPTFSGSGTKAVPMQFYIDSIVIFDTLNQPTGTLPIGITEDDEIGPITFGNGLPDSWLFNSNLASASNRSLTSIVAAMPKAGPFISFNVPNGTDAINWFINGTANTTQALICVDRAALLTVGADAGNCIVMNTRTGQYQQILASGLLSTTIFDSGSKNPLLITESMFRSPWSAGSDPHTIEISSLTNETFNLDKIQVIDADGPLTAGYYEENTPNLKWFTEDNEAPDPEVPGPYQIATLDPDGNFNTLTVAAASGRSVKVLSADSIPGGVNDNLNLYEGMAFQFTGTGFSVFFTLDPKADAVRICWVKDPGPATLDGAKVAAVLGGTSCQTFDNQSATVRYKAARTIAGLEPGNYTVVVQMLPDQGEPAPHVAAHSVLTMQIDAVQIYDDTTANVLNASPNRYETSYVNRVAEGRFAYLGTGWTSVSGTAARLYSGMNYDRLTNVIGAGVVFRTNGGSNVVIYRDTRSGTAPMQVCVNKVSNAARRCTIVLNNGAAGGNQQPISVPLFDATEHTVSIVTTDVGTFFLDAILVTNTPLQPGIYDENDPALVYSTTTDPTRPIYSHWQDITSTAFTDRGAMQSTTPGASVTFEFVGTGFSFITLFDALSANAVNVEICQGACDGTNDFLFTGVNAVSNSLSSTRYGSSHSFTGLPYGTYTVKITEAGTTIRHKLVVDGIEVYGDTPSGYDPAKRMQPGFYDDAALNADGVPYLTFGPNNATWTVRTGSAAATSYNQTNTQSIRFGGVVTFEVENANAITLHHIGATASAVRVCALQAGTFTRTCETQTLVGKNNTTFSAPFTAGAGNYYVSITNMTHGLNLIVDAITVQNLSGALAEGLYEERNPALTFSAPVNPIANSLATDKVVKSVAPGQDVSFSFNGTGFSIILVEGSTTTSTSYNLCVGVGGNCSIIDSNLTNGNLTAAQRAIALTYVGFNADTYTVHLTNNDPTTKPLLVDRVDVLGTREEIANSITGNVENTDAHITYFPFFSLKTVAAAAASGGSQHVGAMQGSVAYFEIEDTTGFEYVRQTLATYGNVQVCSGAIGTPYSPATCGSPIANTTAPVGYQKSHAVSLDGTDVRWVILRNTDGRNMPLDFIRPTIEGAPLTAGYYEETHPTLRWFTEADEADPGPQLPNGPYTLLDSGDFGHFNSLTVAAASGGTVRVLNEDSDTVTLPVSNDKKNLYEGMVFQFFGTGFGVNFTLDNKADAVKICWSNDGATPATLNNAKIASVLNGATDGDNNTMCQNVTADQPFSYDNQSAVVRYKAGRVIQGLAENNYTVVVQMLDDNAKPAVHTAATTPLTMQIDGVQIYGDTLPTKVLDTVGQRYETSFVNSAADNTFLYYGTGWRSFSAANLTTYSGNNYDLISGVIGAGVVFRTNNANAITLYRNTGSGYSPVEVCAIPTAAPQNRKCQTVINAGTAGVQQPIGINFGTGSTAEHIVTITTLEAGAFYLDAIQISNTNTALQPGFYENTDPALTYTNGTLDGAEYAWKVVAGTAYSGRSVHESNDNAAELTFSFTNATGFEVGSMIDRYGGEVEVCYDTNSNWADSTNKCFTYQHESAAVSYLVSRSVTGLNTGSTYHVRVRSVEDGTTVLLNPPGTKPRPTTYALARLRIDYVNILGAALPPVITQSGMYNEDATNGSNAYLQLLPAERWNSFSGTSLGRGFSNLSYVGVVDAAKRVSAAYAGPSATLRVQVPAGGATVVLYTGAAISTNSLNMLVCANNVNDTIPSPPAKPDCVTVTNMRTSNQIVVNGSQLEGLRNAGTVTLSFRNLTPGLFRIDGFQVILGDTLTPGIYDDFLFAVDGLIDLNAVGTTPGTWAVAPTAGTKVAAAYGTTQILGQSTGASSADDPTLRFKFLGTGFSIITTADAAGAEMQICYAATDGFDGTFDGSAGETCDIVTTDTNTTPADWLAKNGNQPKPGTAYQYGFTYYNFRPDPTGGADNSYTVEVRMTDTVLLSTDRLKIDAIAIFSDVEAGNPALAPNQLYDNTNPGLRYEPAPFWTSVTTTTGPVTGPYNKTQHTATNAGAIVQMNVNGNGVILYQTASTGSRYLRVCLRTHLGQECTEYSQYAGRATYFSPVAFYGFGTGDHQLVIENRSHATIMSVDAVRVIP